jgi:nucleoside phosphorylase
MPCAVILTALRVEYLAVRRFLTDLHEEVHPQGTVYEQGFFGDWQVGIAEVGAGNHSAAVESERAIGHFEPDVLLFVGVAGGLKDDVKIGDVVAATKIYAYESGKVGDDEQFLTRPLVGNSSAQLVARARAEARKDDWLKRLSLTEPSPEVFVGAIAAGEKVVAAKESQMFKFLRSSYNDALAVEMEGYGVLNAAFAYPNIQVIVIRGISDMVEGKNDPALGLEGARQKKASIHASAFAFELLAKFKPPRLTNTALSGYVEYANVLESLSQLGSGVLQEYEKRCKDIKNEWQSLNDSISLPKEQVNDCVVLKPAAIELLMEAYKDQDNIIFIIKTNMDEHITTNELSFGEKPESLLKYKSAVKQLLENKLIADLNSTVIGCSRYELTSRGYSFCEQQEEDLENTNDVHSKKSIMKVKVFLSYSPVDEKFKDDLLKSLSPLKREGIIEAWTNRDAMAGENWKEFIDTKLKEADLILLLISSDFIASEHCYEYEMPRVMERLKSGTARVIPILLRPTNWQNSPFASLGGLPRDLKPVSQWDSEDLAFLDISQGIRNVCQSIIDRQQ